ncbi:hypothetical protein BGZ82_002381 [Podila clonocystis]|nr:hypothetical protein BGZ82_002381 [Podila clonocystis]
MHQKKTFGGSTGNSSANGAQQGPSLLTLAQRQQATSGTSSTTGTRTPGGLSRLAGLGATSPSPSLSSSGSTLQPTTTPSLSTLASSSSAAIGTGVRRSLAHLAKPASPASTSSPASSPSLATLSSSTEPRRSLAGLGTRSSPQPSSATSALGSTSPTLGQSNGPLGLQARSGAGLLGSSRLQSRNSPTLAELSKQRLQQQSQPTEDLKPEAQALESAPSTRKPEVARDVVVTTSQTSQPTAVSGISLLAPPSSPSSTPISSISESMSSSTLFGHEAASPAVPLIAPPSHFALSIFAKLDSVPSPTLHTTLSSLSASSYDTADTRNQHLTCSRTNLDIITAFEFNEPSPDDIVFKAQGQRALPPGSLASHSHGAK